MAISFLTPINLGKNELQAAVIQNLAAAPGSPAKGQVYFDTVANHEYVYNGSGWEQGSGGGGAGTVTTVSAALTSIPWYTIAVANPTSTPAITISLTAAQAQASFLATPTGSTGVVGLRTIVAGDLPALNAITAPTGAVSMNSQNITNVLDPTSAQMASTKNYADTHSFGSATVANSTVLIGPTSGGPLAPTWRLLASGDIPSLAGTTYDGTLVHIAGTETITGAKTFSSLPAMPAQTANTIYAGPGSAGPTAPTFRTLVAADLPAGTGTVTSVGLALTSMPWFTVTTSSVTTTGTLTIGLTAAQTANSFLATPSGSAGVVGLRTIVAADVPKTLDHTWVTDFDTQVRTSRLDQMAAPTADLSINTHKLTNVVDPTNPQDAATKNYVDLGIQGLVQKPTAKVATVAALSPTNTYSAGVLTATGVGILTVDGYNTVLGDVILVKNEAAPANNGLYTVTTAGTAGVAYVLTRSTSMNTASEFSGAFIPVDGSGTVNQSSLWLFNGTIPVVLGTSSVTFVELNKAADILGTTNQITLTGNVISIATGYVGQSSITTLGTIGTGTWQGNPVGLLYGGTGVAAATPLAARGGIGATGKYQATIGDGATTTFNIAQATHLLASDKSILVQVMNDTTGAVVFPDVVVSSAGQVSITFAVAPTSNQYRAVLIG